MEFELGQTLPAKSKFHGSTFDSELDYERLNRQERVIFDLLASAGKEEWLTLQQIQDRTIWAHPPNGYMLTSVSARIRSIRAHGFRIDTRRIGGGLWMYRLFLGGEEDE